MNFIARHKFARLDLVDGDSKYTVVTWHDGETNRSRAEENGVHLGGFHHAQVQEDGWSVAELLLITIARRSPWGIDAPTLKSAFDEVLSYQRSLPQGAKNYLKKGSKVYIEGQLETRKWQDPNGQYRYSTEVVLRPYRSELHMLDGRGGSSNGDQQPTRPTERIDDEVPF